MPDGDKVKIVSLPEQGKRVVDVHLGEKGDFTASDMTAQIRGVSSDPDDFDLLTLARSSWGTRILVGSLADMAAAKFPGDPRNILNIAKFKQLMGVLEGGAGGAAPPVTFETARTALDEMGAERFDSALEEVESQGWDHATWEKGFTLLHWSARNGKLELCKFFIGSCGADPFIQDEEGLTPKDHIEKNISVLKSTREEILAFFTQLEEIFNSGSGSGTFVLEDYVLDIGVSPMSGQKIQLPAGEGAGGDGMPGVAGAAGAQGTLASSLAGQVGVNEAGQPIDASGQPILDASGQPIQLQLDANGQPVLDASGQPIQLDSSGQPIQNLDASGQPIPTGQGGQPGQLGQFGQPGQPGQPGQFGQPGQPQVDPNVQAQAQLDQMNSMVSQYEKLLSHQERAREMESSKGLFLQDGSKIILPETSGTVTISDPEY